MRNVNLLTLVAVAIAAAALPAPASAQPADPFRLDRYLAPPTTEDGLALQQPVTLGHLRWSAGLVIDYAHGPLVLEDRSTGDSTKLVEHRLLAHLVAALGLIDRVEVHLRLPVLLTQSGDASAIPGVVLNDPDSAGVADAALGGSVKLVGEDDEGFQLGISAELLLPIGSDDGLAGDDGVGMRGILMSAYDAGPVIIGVQLGVAYRPTGDYGTSQIGTEILFGGGLYVPVGDNVTLMAEVFGGNTPRADQDKTALEGLIGGRYTLDMGLALSAGVSLGFTETAGVPDVRALFGIGYAPPREGDRDGDGYLDSEDGCPDEPEDFDEFEDENGCPDPDNDQDGILDDPDQCPMDPEDRDNFEDENGCPDPDNDQDGFPDTIDQCPNDPEDRDDFEDDDGCPDPDNDQDTVLDVDDACPMDPGPPSNNGCPEARIEGTQIRIVQRIEFDIDQSTLRPESIPVLQQVLRILQDNPDIGPVRVEGHTDNRHSESHNRGLSQRRAGAVRQWLIDHGIAANRLQARGFGETRPIESNETEAGRQANRRVEFHWGEETQ